MDSFVRQAGGNADLIYGDEGVVDIPPYDYFDPIHRINAGIYDTRRKGLTTGHGSYLPDAWGADEFTGNEWSMSGAGSQPPRNIYRINQLRVETRPVILRRPIQPRSQRRVAVAVTFKWGLVEPVTTTL